MAQRGPTQQLVAELHRIVMLQSRYAAIGARIAAVDLTKAPYSLSAGDATNAQAIIRARLTQIMTGELNAVTDKILGNISLILNRLA